MVFAFVLQTVLPGPCRILYSVVFGCDNFIDTVDTGSNFEESRASETFIKPFDSITDGKNNDPAFLRLLRKEALSQIALRVQSEFGFKKVCSFKGFDEETSRLDTDNVQPEHKMGVFRQPATRFFTTEKMIIWQAALNCGFTLICEMHENIVLADHILRLMIKYLQDQSNILNPPSEALLKVDRLATVVNEFLPGGQLLFSNNRVLRQIQKKLEKNLIAK